jgi:hypothetical protein
VLSGRRAVTAAYTAPTGAGTMARTRNLPTAAPPNAGTIMTC